MPFFNNDGVKIYYEETGDGEPLLLINGLASDTRQWIPLVSDIKTSHRIIMYDMRCAGKSDKPDAELTIGDLSDEAAALLNYLGHRKVSVLGFSMGGFVALDLYSKAPHIFNRLFLLSTAPSMKGPYPPSKEAIELLRRTDVSPELLGKVYDMVFGPALNKTFSKEEFIRFRLTDDSPQPADAYLRQLGAIESYRFNEKTVDVNIPTVIITGENDKIIPPENSKWMSERIAGSELHILKNVGHVTPLEAPSAIATIIRNS